jgi:hypothetical protein
MPRKPGLQGSGQKILECGSSHLQGLHCMDLSFVLKEFRLNRLLADVRRGRCHVVESLMRVYRVAQLKSCGGDDFAPRLHG